MIGGSDGDGDADGGGSGAGSFFGGVVVGAVIGAVAVAMMGGKQAADGGAKESMYGEASVGAMYR